MKKKKKIIFRETLEGDRTLIEAARNRVKTVGLDQVNAVLMRPHWRHDTRAEPLAPGAATNQQAGLNGRDRSASAVPFVRPHGRCA